MASGDQGVSGKKPVFMVDFAYPITLVYDDRFFLINTHMDDFHGINAGKYTSLFLGSVIGMVHLLPKRGFFTEGKKRAKQLKEYLT